MRRLLGIGAASAAMLLLAGCGGTTVQGAVPTAAAAPAVTPAPKTPTPSPTPTEPMVFLPGPPEVEIHTQEGVAKVGVRRYAWRATATNPDARPPQNGSFLVLDVVVSATEGKVQVNPLYFTLRSPAGEELQTVLGADGTEPVLASRELQASESVDGIVAFDTDRGNVTVQIADELGNQVGTIAIPAG